MLGRLSAQPGQRETLLGHLLAAARLVGDAPGCEMYAVFSSARDPDGIWVVESWRSQADHEASLLLPGVKELIAKARPLIATMHDPVPLSPEGGKGLGR
jgi:quinol monooxygenase YgiN